MLLQTKTHASDRIFLWDNVAVQPHDHTRIAHPHRGLKEVPQTLVFRHDQKLDGVSPSTGTALLLSRRTTHHELAPPEPVRLRRSPSPAPNESHTSSILRELTTMPINDHLLRLHLLPSRPHMKHLPSIKHLLITRRHDLFRVLCAPCVPDIIEDPLRSCVFAVGEFVLDDVGC